MGGVAGSFPLQVVPVISEFSYSSFTPGSTLFLRGSGFIEGNDRVRFGSTLVNDPDTGGNQVDWWNNGSYLYVAIPNGAQSHVRVSTIGGTSNVVEVDAPVAPTEYPTPKIVNSSGTRIFVAPDGSFSTLTENADKSFVMTTKNGIKHNFNAAGLQTSTVDRNGNTTSYGYDGSLRLTSITDPMGLVTSFVYANNRVSTITDPSGRVTKLAYDGNLTSITDPDSSVRYFGYNARHLMTAQTSSAATSRNTSTTSLDACQITLARWLDAHHHTRYVDWAGQRAGWARQRSQSRAGDATDDVDRPIPGWQRRRDNLQDRPLWRRHRSCAIPIPAARGDNPRCRRQPAANDPTQWRACTLHLRRQGQHAQPA